MATLLESLGFFSDITDFFLPFLLVFAVMYAIFMKTKMLSESSNINAVVAFSIALIVAFSGAGKFITRLTPFLTILFVILFLMFLSFLFFGADPKWLFNTKGPSMVIVMIGIIFVFYVMGNLYGSSFSAIDDEELVTEEIVTEEGEVVTVTKEPVLPGYETCDFSRLRASQAMSCILGHPKFLSMVVLLGLLAIATFFVVYVPKNA